MRISRTVRSYAYSSFGFFFLLEVMLAAAILFWPSFEENVEAIKSIAPIRFLRDVVDGMAKEGVVAYVNGQHFFKGCNTLGIAAAVLLAMNAVAGESQRGTLEIWLARPQSRTRILLEKWTLGALALCIPIFATSASVPWLLTFVDESVPLGLMMLCSVHQSLFLLLIYGATFLLSCLMEKPVNIAFTMLFFTTFEFAIYLVKEMTYYSIFRATDLDDFARIVNRGTLDWSLCAPFAVGVVVLVVASTLVFRRRLP